MPIRRIRRRRLPDTVAEQIVTAIRGGEFKAGDRLPPERELAERFGVSRNVVREAVNELRSRGLLVTRQGAGSVVSGRTHKPVSDLLGSVTDGRVENEWKLLELRSALEGDVARLAAEKATSEDIAALEQILDAYDSAGADLGTCVNLDIAFHKRLAEAAHNELFGMVLASLDELLVRTRRAALERSGSAVAALSHRDIFEAVKARQAGRAAEAMKRHLALTLENLALASDEKRGRKGVNHEHSDC